MWGEAHTWEGSCQSWHVFDTVLKTGVTWNPIIHRWTFCSQILMGYFYFLCRWRKWSLSGPWGQRGNSKANPWVLPAENRLEPGSQGTCSCWRHGEHDYIRETDTFGHWTVCLQNWEEHRMDIPVSLLGSALHSAPCWVSPSQPPLHRFFKWHPCCSWGEILYRQMDTESRQLFDFLYLSIFIAICSICQLQILS